MRSSLLRSFALIALSPAALLAQEEASSTRPFMRPDTGLMVWTLIIFVILLFVLSRYAFGPLTRAVQARERSLQEAIDAANADRAAAAALLAEHQAAIEAARTDAQKLIAEGRAVAEKMRADLLEHTRKEQQDMLERARRDIEAEKDKAIAQLRKEAVDLALAGASKVIEQNLDSAKNRQLVESYLASIGSLKVTQ
ncbi:MAG: synthase subunit b [Gemmatimonadetes bacterium]|nr:synthase subunit b [Gemmatimonadota bacterium]